ncbi:MAG: Aureobasidin resistance protein Aur1 [Cirrosporium novae-zelandiae]|nr:MAG: Aureobasidin resistance protein Aur1 [Cirrosporium novae-zelandiae]
MKKLNFSWRPDASSPFPSPKLSLSMPPIRLVSPNSLKRRIRSALRSRQSPASNLATLQTSFAPADTLRALRNHQWSYYDGQYIILIILGIFSLSMIESPGAIIKTGIASLLLTSLLLPITRQFFLPFLPIITYLVFFYACGFIPSEYRPPISVRVLPALENIFYGANISNILSAHKATMLDLLAWLPYGIIHFGGPFVISGIIFIWGPPKTLPAFAKAFGYMNMAGALIQVFFPTSPPWYENKYGLAPADYSIPGDPAGLARIDKLFGVDLYTSTFTASPMVFGAFPSLHAGCATIEALFLSHVFPRLTGLFVVYTMWLWWATMYLSHHYAVDLVGGSLLAGITFYISKAKFLPRLQSDKSFRWDYDYVEIGDSHQEYGYTYTDLDGDFRSDSDEWTVGTSSSVSSGSRSPVDENSSMWEGETLASQSDNDMGR